MFEMTQVTKAYRTDLLETHALREFSLKVDKGEFVAVTGPSGSGKTTFLNVAGLLETFDSGSYRLDDVDVSKLDDDARSKVRNHKIGFIFQSFNLIPQLTVLENIALPLFYLGWSTEKSAAHAAELAETVGLSQRLRHRPTELSGGQQQRVAIARALANDPKIILADEPTGNLDTSTGDQIMALLCDLNRQGKTIIMVTHEPSIALHAKRRIHMLDGHIERIEDDA